MPPEMGGHFRAEGEGTSRQLDHKDLGLPLTALPAHGGHMRTGVSPLHPPPRSDPFPILLLPSYPYCLEGHPGAPNQASGPP